MVRSTAESDLRGFLDGQSARPTLALLYGRRRIGKSTLLVDEVRRRGGFYFEATRVPTPEQLDRLGRALGDHHGVGRIALGSWDDAIDQLLRLGRQGPVPVVIDELGYVLEADRSVPSVISATLGPGAAHRESSQARLVLCGSAVGMMRRMTTGEAPLRGRAALELLAHPDEDREVAARLGLSDLRLAAHLYAVIGGVIGYATDMVDHDLPGSLDDFDRWIADRVLKPSATLHHEAVTLLAEDPDLAGTRPTLFHGILAAIATGSVAAGQIGNRVGQPVSNLSGALNRLVDAGFVVRHQDPLRGRRPRYALADPYLRFHYAVLDPNRTALRDRDPVRLWRDRLAATFHAQVRGPVFEQQARSWTARHASAATIGGEPVHLGPSSAAVDGVDLELDVVATGEGDTPGDRSVLAIGEAKAGERVGRRHLGRLERAREALGPRAADAKLLLFAVDADDELRDEAGHRHDVELIDLQRLYHGT